LKQEKINLKSQEVQKTHNQEVAGSEFHTDLILYSKLIWVIWMLIKSAIGQVQLLHLLKPYQIEIFLTSSSILVNNEMRASADQDENPTKGRIRNLGIMFTSHPLSSFNVW
jgi:hypothetical protein